MAYSLGKCPRDRAAEIEAFLLAGGPDVAAVLDAAPDDAVLRHLRGLGELPAETVTQAQQPPRASAALAQSLLAGLASRSEAERQALQLRLQEALNRMDPFDRELIELRHYDELSNVEAAAVLSVETDTASKRYIRAIRRLKAILDELTPS